MVRFGPFCFDPTTGSLWRGTEFLSLLPKDAAVLGVLVQYAGQIVTKDALLDAVWPQTYVTDTVVKNGIGRLRRALGDDLKTPRYIQTYPRRGYRFVGTVETQEPEVVEEGRPPSNLASQTAGILPEIPALMVGREAELARLQERFGRALHGQRQVVFVVGEVGIGKTTLIDAFVAEVAAHGDLWLAHGQCIEHHGEGEPYGPVLEALDRLCRGPHGARLLALLRQEAPLWVAQLPGLLPAAEIEALERHSRQATPARMQRELAVALDRLSMEIPLVFVLEDLHWSDYATLDLLAVLTQRRDPARLLVLGSSRPGDIGTRTHPLSPLVQRLGRSAHYHEISLITLTEPDIAAYLTHRFSAPTWAPRLTGWLQRRSGGNPLFLVTIVDYLVHQGVLPADGSAPALGQELNTLEATIPASLRHIIAAQFRQLAPAEQQALEVASVAGAEFSAAVVAAGLEEPVIPAEACCEGLARRGNFLEPRRAALWYDGTAASDYGFRHTLYQQVIYEGLPAGRRQQLHRRLAARLEQAYGEQVGEVASELAQHWQLGGDAERAVRYRGLAAQKANRCAAPREAMEQVAQALQLLRTLPDTRERRHLELRLRLTLLPALLTLKGFAAPEVAHTYAQAQELWRALGESTPLPPTLSGLWREFYWVGPLASPLS
jgi:predicted ATPase/DNA-binding winged helix-turn-helix (wHTH) protein